VNSPAKTGSSWGKLLKRNGLNERQLFRAKFSMTWIIGTLAF